MLLGRWIEMASVQEASRALEHLADLVPSVAHRLTSGRKDVSVSDLGENDRILVRPCEQIPIDGKVIEGSSSVNKAFLTGELRPVTKQVGDEVVAGAVNGEGALTFKVATGCNVIDIPLAWSCLPIRNFSFSSSWRFIHEHFYRCSCY